MPIFYFRCLKHSPEWTEVEGDSFNEAITEFIKRHLDPNYSLAINGVDLEIECKNHPVSIVECDIYPEYRVYPKERINE